MIVHEMRGSFFEAMQQYRTERGPGWDLIDPIGAEYTGQGLKFTRGSLPPTLLPSTRTVDKCKTLNAKF